MSENDKFFFSLDSLILKGVPRENIRAINLHYEDSEARKKHCNVSGTSIHYHDSSNPVSAGDKMFIACNRADDDDCQLCKGYSRKVISFEEIEFDNK